MKNVDQLQSSHLDIIPSRTSHYYVWSRRNFLLLHIWLNIFNKDPLRTRKLLMHKREIMKLLGQVKQDGLTLIPISVYFKGSRVKVQVGLCKGKKQHDKRDAMAQRDAKRTIDRELKMRNR